MGEERQYTEEDVRRLTGVLVEQFANQLEGVAEGIAAIQQQTDKIPAIELALDRLSTDVTAFKAALKATNQDLHDLEVRMTHLEAAL